MVDAVTIVAVSLLLLGVFGGVLPMLPGAPLSLAGVYPYWWHTDFTDPGIAVLVGLTALGLLAILAEYAGGAVSAKFGDAATGTVVLATVVGIVALVFTSPIGLLIGVTGTVFGAEYYRHCDARRSAKAAAYATAGVLASSVIQVLLTATILVAFLLAVVV